MATDITSIPVNGNYAPHQGFGGIESQNNYAYGNNATTQPASTQPPPTSTTPAAAPTAAQSDIPKDEVGWYFVEQYYTTLSRSPEKLYLFYNKRSQFVSGQETDKVQVCLGQRAINERIKELDFQDCKVRVTNVDSQASDANIVIQVIGEISNKSQPHKKFTQTFVLATQTNGYFVLNDIFRYLVDEEDEVDAEVVPATEEVPQTTAVESVTSGFQEPAPTVTDVESKTLTSAEDPAAIEQDAQQVDRELEQKISPEQKQVEEPLQPTINGVADPEPEAADVEEVPSTLAAAQEAVSEPAPVSIEPEQPVEPEPTPSPPKKATPQPAPASKPSAPMSWASMAASANRSIATPVAAPVATPTTQSRPTPPKTATPPSTTPSATAPTTVPTAPAAQREDLPADASQADEWTAVGGGHNRQQSRQTNYQQQEGPVTRAFIKNVDEGISDDDLKTHLNQYGEVVYFDLNRQRNSAFIEFKTPEGFTAATAANPHNLGGNRFYVEERRQFVPRGNFQGGRGRGGAPGQQRGNFQGGRGGYPPRGRGNASAPRGRGSAAQAA